MISVLIFCVLVAVLAALVVYSLFELDNSWVVPQVVSGLIACLLAFTLAAMISNGQVTDVTPLVNQTVTNTAPFFENTTYTYLDHRIVWTDPSVSLILMLVGVCEGILALTVTVLTVLRIFIDGWDTE